MFSVLHGLLQMILGEFLLKKVIQMVKWACRLPCNNFNCTLHQPSNVTWPCCGRKWGVTSCWCPCNFRNRRAAPLSSLSLQPWNGIPVRRGSLVLLLKHCWISSGFPEVVFNVCLTVERGSCTSCLVGFPLTHPLQWSWADGSSGKNPCFFKVTLTVAVELQCLFRNVLWLHLSTHFSSQFELFKQNFNSFWIFCAGTQLQGELQAQGDWS